MKLGIIGVGHLASSVLKGLLHAGVAPHTICLSPRGHGPDLAAQHGFNLATDNASLVTESDVVLLAVRPADAADVINGLLQGHTAQFSNWQRGEGRDAALERAVGILEGKALFGVRALDLDRIGQPPMGTDRLAVPSGAVLVRGLVADRENEVEPRRVPGLEFAHVLGAQNIRVMTLLVQHLDRERVEFRVRRGPGRPGLEPVARRMPQDGFGKDRAGGIAGAKEEYPVFPVGLRGHGRPALLAGQAKIDPAAATIQKEIVEEALRHLHLDRVAQRGAVALLADQSGPGQGGQIGRGRTGLGLDGLRDFLRRDTVGIASHEQPVDGKPLGVAKGREAGGTFHFHIS